MAERPCILDIEKCPSFVRVFGRLVGHAVLSVDAVLGGCHRGIDGSASFGKKAIQAWSDARSVFAMGPGGSTSGGWQAQRGQDYERRSTQSTGTDENHRM